MLCTVGIVAAGKAFTPAGTLLSTFCQSTSGTDAGGVHYDGAWESFGIYANGSGGTYSGFIGTDINGCHFPSGYYFSYSSSPSTIHWTNSQSGQSGDFVYFTVYNWTVADGAGGSYTGGTGTGAYYGEIIDNYYDATTDLNYIVAFDPQGGGTGVPSYFEYSVPSVGTVISTQCLPTSSYDANGTLWEGAWDYGVTYADGTGGTYSTIQGSNVNGCYVPAGYYYGSSQGSTLSINWTHGTSSGSFTYGYEYMYSTADGYGGISNNSGVYISVEDGTVVDYYFENINSVTVTYQLYFRLSDTSLQQRVIAPAGTLLSSGCSQIQSIDANNTQWTVNSYRETYADGSGGTYSNDDINSSQCGYLPSGYYTSISNYRLVVNYLDEFGTGQIFDYGQRNYSYQADGYGGSVYFEYDYLNYTYGFTFYSYYDSAGQRNVLYKLDPTESMGPDKYFIEYQSI